MPMRGRRKSSGVSRPAKEATPDAVAAAPQPRRPARAPKTPPSPESDQGSEAVLGKRKRSKADAPPAKASKAQVTAQREAVVETSGVRDQDPEAEGPDDESESAMRAAQLRPPPVDSPVLPLPWKGRLGYACLNTYLRTATPPVFSSRTCRIASILEHRHPLAQPEQPEHATKNRPDKSKPADVGRGQRWVEALGLANVRDIGKMLRWNERYGIRFLRLSSEMFPFASHEEYGYGLGFAAAELAAAGQVAAQLGHRLTTHPGQYTQLGSPRRPVIDNAVRDLAYHAEMLDLLKLPEQQDRDAVMILHLGGVFGDREATLERFRANYRALPANVKKRLVLENDDVCWSVHELLPVCEELNIPLVLDWHHHNILFDPAQVREGSADAVPLLPRILATWRRKRITPKMHYSEPCPGAVTPRQRRKHRPRVATLPPCPPDMDLMIEAKDKEQAVFELMRTFRLPGFDAFADMVPHSRDDQSVLAKPYTKKELKDRQAASDRGEALDERSDRIVLDHDFAMGGPLGRVYWPPGMEHWLRPPKRVVASKPAENETKNVAAVKTEPDHKPLVNGKPKKAKTAPPPESEHSDTPDLSDDVKPAKLPAKARPARTRKRVSYVDGA